MELNQDYYFIQDLFFRIRIKYQNHIKTEAIIKMVGSIIIVEPISIDTTVKVYQVDSNEVIMFDLEMLTVEVVSSN